MKPTAQDAVDYLNRVAPDRVWSHKDGIILETFEGFEPLQFAFEEELHWLKGGVVGARGYALWFADNYELIGEKKASAEFRATKETNKITKLDRVVAMISVNTAASSKELVDLIMKDCEIGEAYARTLYYQAKKVVANEAAC
jgi:hypothetical protein